MQNRKSWRWSDWVSPDPNLFLDVRLKLDLGLLLDVRLSLDLSIRLAVRACART